MPSADELVKVASAQNQPEAELVQGLLRDAGAPSVVRRSGGADVPDFLTAGARDVLVPASMAATARDALRPDQEAAPFDLQAAAPAAGTRQLDGQTVVVIGGSAGIGLATARAARDAGAEVVMAGRNPERLERAAQELGARSTAAFDAVDPAALDRFLADLPKPVDHVLASIGGPNSGAARPVRLRRRTRPASRRVMEASAASQVGVPGAFPAWVGHHDNRVRARERSP